jgi:hypothetical protein
MVVQSASCAGEHFELAVLMQSVLILSLVIKGHCGISTGGAGKDWH